MDLVCYSNRNDDILGHISTIFTLLLYSNPFWYLSLPWKKTGSIYFYRWALNFSSRIIFVMFRQIRLPQRITLLPTSNSSHSCGASFAYVCKRARFWFVFVLYEKYSVVCSFPVLCPIRPSPRPAKEKWDSYLNCCNFVKAWKELKGKCKLIFTCNWLLNIRF